MRAIVGLAALGFALMLGGCAVVKASADVVGAAGRLGGAVVSETAGAIGSAAGSGSSKPSKKSGDCSGKDNAGGCE